jgi:hypothetical protein
MIQQGHLRDAHPPDLGLHRGMGELGFFQLAVRPPASPGSLGRNIDGFGPAASTDTSSQAESFGRAD